jgi:hypothetical protein
MDWNKEMKINMKVIDIKDQQFTYLKATRFIGFNKVGKALWECLCKCGSTTVATGVQLRNNHTRSCGCLQREQAAKFNTTHGFLIGTSAQKTFYNSYNGMITRCIDVKRKDYKHYGGRGIKVCARWLESFENFRDDMYESYLEHHNANNGDTSIDRIDVNGNYEPSNIRWATQAKQNRNTRVNAKSVNFLLHKKIWQRLKANLTKVIKLNSQYSIMELYLGCSLLEFRKYIELRWTSGMSWDNYGYGEGKWVFDHAIGVRNFDLVSEEDQYRCFNRFNLQPMWWRSNLNKR